MTPGFQIAPLERNQFTDGFSGNGTTTGEAPPEPGSGNGSDHAARRGSWRGIPFPAGRWRKPARAEAREKLSIPTTRGGSTGNRRLTPPDGDARPAAMRPNVPCRQAGPLTRSRSEADHRSSACSGRSPRSRLPGRGFLPVPLKSVPPAGWKRPPTPRRAAGANASSRSGLRIVGTGA